MCPQVLGRDDCEEMVHLLAAEGLCRPVLKEGTIWYRYECLVESYLKTRLMEKDEALALQTLTKASAWSERRGMLGMAMRYAIASQDWGRCERIVRDSGLMYAGNLRFPKLRKLVESLPDKQISGYPALLIAKAGAYLAGTKTREAERLLRVLRFTCEDMPDDSPERVRLDGELKPLEALLATQRGDVEEGKRLALEAYESSALESVDLRMVCLTALGTLAARGVDPQDSMHILESCEESALGTMNATMEHLAKYYRGMQFINMGDLCAAERLFREMPERDGSERSSLPYLGLADIGLARISYERNDLDSAKERLSDDLGRNSNKSVEVVVDAHLFLARVLQALGDNEQALRLIIESQAHAKREGNARMQRLAALSLAEHYANCGMIFEAQSTLGNVRMDGMAGDYEMFESARLVIAKTAMLAGDFPECVRASEDAIERLNLVNRVGSLVKWYALAACAHYEQGEKDDALANIGHTIRIGSAGGYVRSLMDYSHRLDEVINLYCERTEIDPSFATKIQVEYARSICMASRKTTGAQKDGMSILTEREREICRFLLQGYTSSDVSEALGLSPNTVHTHRMNIYAKLDVHNRKELISRLEGWKTS